MSEIVKNELDAIKAFETETEKRRSTLTLNELNYISDKQLHKKSEEPSPTPTEDQWPDIPFVFEMDASQAAGGYPPVTVLKSTSYADLETYMAFDGCYCLGYLRNYSVLETTINQLYLIKASVVSENSVTWDVTDILPGCNLVYTFATDTAELINNGIISL